MGFIDSLRSAFTGAAPAHVDNDEPQVAVGSDQVTHGDESPAVGKPPSQGGSSFQLADGRFTSLLTGKQTRMTA